MKRYLFLDIDGVLANEEYIINARLEKKISGRETEADKPIQK